MLRFNHKLMEEEEKIIILKKNKNVLLSCFKRSIKLWITSYILVIRIKKSVLHFATVQTLQTTDKTVSKIKL